MYFIPLKSREKIPYVWWHDVFSPEELDKLQEAAANASQEATVAHDVVETSIRRSKVRWLYPNEEWGWVFKKLAGVIAEANLKYYGFDITSLEEGIQLTSYDANDSGTYGWHQDFRGDGTPRKLSLVLQLSEPTEYKGGELELLTSKTPIAIEKERGRITIFPSWTLHQVTPVTEGTRQSLVVWVSGPEFK